MRQVLAENLSYLIRKQRSVSDACRCRLFLQRLQLSQGFLYQSFIRDWLGLKVNFKKKAAILTQFYQQEVAVLLVLAP